MVTEPGDEGRAGTRSTCSRLLLRKMLIGKAVLLVRRCTGQSPGGSQEAWVLDHLTQGGDLGTSPCFSEMARQLRVSTMVCAELPEGVVGPRCGTACHDNPSGLREQGQGPPLCTHSLGTRAEAPGQRPGPLKSHLIRTDEGYQLLRTGAGANPSPRASGAQLTLGADGSFVQGISILGCPSLLPPEDSLQALLAQPSPLLSELVSPSASLY